MNRKKKETVRFKTIIEPFRIKAVEPIQITTYQQRAGFLKKAHYNLFALESKNVILDLLTDSGFSAMSASQWAALSEGDESYAGARSFYNFQSAIQNLMPFKHIIPTHQGRAAEAILFSILGGKSKKIPSNAHFDTTRANIEMTGAKAVDLVIEEGKQPFKIHPFKGNIDLDKLDLFLKENHKQTPCIMVTITNNAGGGQPVSLENIRAISERAKQYKIPFLIDGCRFAENAYLIKQREKGQKDRTIKDIVREIFSYADGMTMSAKKDGFANIGGWLALNNDELARMARSRLIVTEGFPTYGGLAGRDMEAIAKGIEEIIDESYLTYRIRSVEYVCENLEKLGIPIVKPAGGHASFIDARTFLPHIPSLQYPGQALAVALYLEGGIRSCEIGSVMYGRKAKGHEEAAMMELLRLAFPRRVIYAITYGLFN